MLDLVCVDYTQVSVFCHPPPTSRCCVDGRGSGWDKSDGFSRRSAFCEDWYLCSKVYWTDFCNGKSAVNLKLRKGRWFLRGQWRHVKSLTSLSNNENPSGWTGPLLLHNTWFPLKHVGVWGIDEHGLWCLYSMIQLVCSLHIEWNLLPIHLINTASINNLSTFILQC